MASVNKVHIIGNCGKDPELRQSPSGTSVCVLSLATSRTWKDKTTGDKMEETEWHRVVFYDRQAEIASEYIQKGDPVYVEGRLKTRKWEKDGHTNYTTEVIVENLQLLGQRREKADSAPPTRGASSNASTSRRPAADAPAPPPQRRAAAPTSGTAFDDMPNDDFDVHF